MKTEEYERAELKITEFDSEDVITTSSAVEIFSRRVLRDTYELF